MNFISFVRIGLSLVLLYGSFLETGVFTASILFLIMLYMELDSLQNLKWHKERTAQMEILNDLINSMIAREMRFIK